MRARFSVAEREKQNQPKRSRCPESVSLVQPGWRRAPFLRRHCHEMMGAALLYRSVMRCCTARRAARAGGRKGSS